MKYGKGRKLHNSGMAMTEVVIAFLLLTIIFSMLYHCIRFSSNMLMHATDTDREVADYENSAATVFTGSADPYVEGALVNTSTIPSLEFEDVNISGSKFHISVKTGEKVVPYHPGGDSAATPVDAQVKVYSTTAP